MGVRNECEIVHVIELTKGMAAMRNKGRWISLVSLVCGLLSATGAYANYFCGGPVTQVALSPSGALTVYAPAAGLNFAYICSIDTAFNSVSIEVCKAMLATLLQAQATGATITFAYNDALTCATHPAWMWLTGWYYGPQIS